MSEVIKYASHPTLIIKHCLPVLKCHTVPHMYVQLLHIN
jgi:hypothetical protein